MTLLAPATDAVDSRGAGMVNSPSVHVQHAIEHAAHLLPAQGPITVFIHHNPLHALEDLSFDEGAQQGAALCGCQPYLSEDRYHEMLERGRIRAEDLSAVLLDDLGERADELLGFMGTRHQLRLKMLKYRLRLAPAAELRWFVAETDSLKRFRPDAPPAVRQRFIEETRRWVTRRLRQGSRTGTGVVSNGTPHHAEQLLENLIDDFGRSSVERSSEATWEAFTLQALWRVCRAGVHGLKVSAQPHHLEVRHRDLLLEATGADSDLLVHEILIPFCAAFLDQGFTRWSLPHRGRGFLHSFSALYRHRGGPLESWLGGLGAELERFEQAGANPLESIAQSLELLGVPESEWQTYVTATLLALRGWAGMMHQLEIRGDRVADPAPPGSLVEFLAVRLILERLALKHLARQTLGYRDALSGLRSALRSVTQKHHSLGADQRAFLVFQLAQVLGWLPSDLARLSKKEWALVAAEVEAFSPLERRRIFHAAFERRYRLQTLDAIAIRAQRPAQQPALPQFQLVCCLDEREESFRRHVEEIAPHAETFAAAGFYNVAIYYRGAADAHFVPLCPVVIRPQHWVVEDVIDPFEQVHRRRARTRRALGAAWHHLHLGSRSLLGGALVTGGLGVLASIPLVARVLMPRWTAQIRRLAARFVSPPPATELQVERTCPTAGTEPGQIGYTVEEMAAIVERVLRDIGLTSGFARLVVITGHGSSSLNNPHESAHDCGACGGGRGGPNARAFARMANDPRIRDQLAARGLTVPHETVFVGAYHNTCDESLAFFDLDRLPPSHQIDFAAARQVLDEARCRNAHERCRRFESAPLTLSPEAALKHVEARAEDLSQTRPEYGHATNAVCIVGRRSRTRGLFLDRRTFLVSYDPQQDDADCGILTRILQAAVPVCAGINLEYYFSYVDPTGWGCGTKLPHNITSFLGVMDGAASDLRPGLPWQMVEVHDPVRLLFVIETTPQRMLRIMERNEQIGKLVRNGWAQLAVLDPASSQLHHFRAGRFEPYQPETSTLPIVPSSVDWYRGHRNHLEYALVQASSGRSGAEV
jgi:uncharacterized protein YbcC (UPF0753/DUF2309 family)